MEDGTTDGILDNAQYEGGWYRLARITKHFPNVQRESQSHYWMDKAGAKYISGDAVASGPKIVIRRVGVDRGGQVLVGHWQLVLKAAKQEGLQDLVVALLRRHAPPPLPSAPQEDAMLVDPADGEGKTDPLPEPAGARSEAAPPTPVQGFGTPHRPARGGDLLTGPQYPVRTYGAGRGAMGPGGHGAQVPFCQRETYEQRELQVQRELEVLGAATEALKTPSPAFLRALDTACATMATARAIEASRLDIAKQQVAALARLRGVGLGGYGGQVPSFQHQQQRLQVQKELEVLGAVATSLTKASPAFLRAINTACATEEYRLDIARQQVEAVKRLRTFDREQGWGGDNAAFRGNPAAYANNPGWVTAPPAGGHSRGTGQPVSWQPQAHAPSNWAHGEVHVKQEVEPRCHATLLGLKGRKLRGRRSGGEEEERRGVGLDHGVTDKVMGYWVRGCVVGHWRAMGGLSMGQLEE